MWHVTMNATFDPTARDNVGSRNAVSHAQQHLNRVHIFLAIGETNFVEYSMAATCLAAPWSATVLTGHTACEMQR
jgi:hypothetical protein